MVRWFHSALTSESAQAEAVFTTRSSARRDGTEEAWTHPTNPELPAADPRRCRLPVQSAGETEEAQTQFLPSRANAGTPAPRICSGEPRQSPRAVSEPPRPQQSSAAAASTRRSRGTPMTLGTAARPPRPPWARRAPPAPATPTPPPPALLTPRRPWRGDPGPSAPAGGGRRGRKGVGSSSAGAAALPRLRRHEGPGRAAPVPP